MTDIKCSVNNCVYNNGNKCTASSIEVAQNFVVDGGTDIEAGRLGENSASSCQTKCVTFKSKNKN